MRTLRKTVGSDTFFIITEVEPAYQDALRDLYYLDMGDGFGRGFPNDTPNLDRAYANFQRYAEEMVLQLAGVRHVPWEKALSAFIRLIEGHDIDWWLAGSAALSVRGMDIEPRDLDLVVGSSDARRLGDLLLDYLYEPVIPVHDWIGDWWGRAFLHARVEWVGGIRADVDASGVTDFGPIAQSRLETVTWRGSSIRVPPLHLQLQVTERRGLVERVDTIRRFISEGV